MQIILLKIELLSMSGRQGLSAVDIALARGEATNWNAALGPLDILTQACFDDIDENFMTGQF